MQRKLAAILAADVVGYSRLIAEDEARTLHAVKLVKDHPTPTIWPSTEVQADCKARGKADTIQTGRVGLIYLIKWLSKAHAHHTRTPHT